MRVLVVSHLALPHVGGVEVLVDLEIRALVEAGHEVIHITSDGAGAGQQPTYPPTVRQIRVPAWHGLERRFQLPYPIFSPSLLSVLWRESVRCDVIHAHGFLFMPSVVALLAGRLRGRPRLLTDHGGIQRFSSRIITALAQVGVETVGRLSARLATGLVVYNARIGQLLQRLAGPQADVRFLPNPVDPAMFYTPSRVDREAARARRGWAPDRRKVLFAGRLIAAKGVQLLLEAADPSYDLVFCGPGDLSLLGPLPRPGVEYLPPRPQAELRELYHAADVLALPAEVREGFPLVIQEALSCGLPAVLAYDPGFEPYRGLPGLTLCERTPAAIRAALAGALAGPRPEAGASLFPDLREWVSRLYDPESLPPGTVSLSSAPKSATA